MSNKATFLSILCLLLVCQHSLGQTLNKCLPFFTNEKVGFDLVGIETANQKKPYTVTLPPHKNARINAAAVLSEVTFNLCGLMQKPEKCPEVPGGAFGYYYINGNCMPMIILTSNIVREPILIENKVKGVSLTYKNDNLDDEKKKVLGPNIQFKVTCNKDNTGVAKWTPSINLLTGELITLSTEHATGCGKGIDDLLDIFQQNKWICCSIFIVIGIIFCLFGRHAYKWTLMLCGFLLGFMAVAGLCYSFGLFHNAQESTKWIALGAAILVGLIVGFLLFKFEVATVMLVCGLLFVVIAIAIIATFLANVEMNKWLEIGIIILVGCIGSALGAYFKEYPFVNLVQS